MVVGGNKRRRPKSRNKKKKGTQRYLGVEFTQEEVKQKEKGRYLKDLEKN